MNSPLIKKTLLNSSVCSTLWSKTSMSRLSSYKLVLTVYFIYIYHKITIRIAAYKACMDSQSFCRHTPYDTFTISHSIRHKYCNVRIFMNLKTVNTPYSAWLEPISTRTKHTVIIQLFLYIVFVFADVPCLFPEEK